MRRTHRVWAAILTAWLAGVPALAQETSPRRAPEKVGEQGEAYHLFMLGRYLEAEGDVDGAVNAFRRAAELDPNAAEVLAELGALYARRNRVDEAVTMAERALARDPNNQEAHRVLGWIEAGRAERPNNADAPAAVARAIDHFEKARNRLAPDARLDLTLARLYLASSSAAKAVDLLGDVLRYEPGFTEALLLLSEAYEETGRRGDAIAALEQFTPFDRSAYRVATRLGELYERERRWQDAATAYQRALATAK